MSRTTVAHQIIGSAGRTRGAAWLLLVPVLVTACGDSDPTEAVAPDPQVEPFVGDWEAEEFQVTSEADSERGFDLIEAGGSFTINVQPSGQYTAILELPDLPTPEVELGQMSVVGESVRLDPQNGAAATSSFEFDGPDRLILDGPTEFDFGQDGTAEEATARIVLQRTEG